MPEPAVIPGQDQPVAPPVYTPEQQAHIQTIIDKRIGTVKDKYEGQITDLTKQMDDLKKLVSPPVPDPKNDDKGKGGKESAALEAQYKGLLDQEKANSASALDIARKKDEELKTVREQNAAILKNQAIRDAAASLAMESGIEFHDFSLVRALTENSIEWNDEHKTYVVRENGVIKQNNSLQPMTLTEYLEGFAAGRPFLVKGTTKGGTGSSESNRSANLNGVSVVHSKSDLKSVKDKSDYISKFGLEAWEKLPVK